MILNLATMISLTAESAAKFHILLEKYKSFPVAQAPTVITKIILKQ